MNALRTLFTIALMAVIPLGVAAQRSSFAELGLGVGKRAVAPVVAYHVDWSLGKKHRVVLGTGLRFTGFYGNNATFTSAPNSLAGNPASVDSIFAPAPSLNSLNLLINLGVNVSDKLQIGFNIDALGFSFGPTGKPDFIQSGNRLPVSASPTKVNLLLIDNNDIGSLGSYIYVRYKFTDKWGVRLAYQHLFSELTTTTAVQTVPEINDRFRAKDNHIYLGVSYRL